MCAVEWDNITTKHKAYLLQASTEFVPFPRQAFALLLLRFQDAWFKINGWNVNQELTIWIISENSEEFWVKTELVKTIRTDRRTNLYAEICFCGTLNVIWTLQPVLAAIPRKAEVRILIRSISAGLDSITHGGGRQTSFFISWSRAWNICLGFLHY